MTDFVRFCIINTDFGTYSDANRTVNQVQKGDRRKAAIIDTAENLFYSKGYENTSIQDVLDALKLSKGGFYHHFESKLSLLVAICEKRTSSYAENCRSEIKDKAYTGIEKLNCVLSYSSYLKDATFEFISIMLEVAYRQQQVMLREHMSMAGVELMHSLALEAINEGMAQNLFYSKFNEELTDIVLNLAHMLTDEVSEIAVVTEDEYTRTDCINQKIAAYTYACETLLNAPHGSLKLLDDTAISNINSSLAFANSAQAS